MPNTRLMPHRQSYVFKIYNEVEKYSSSSTPDRECQKVYFLNLISKTNELNECEKNYCQEMFIRNYELHNVINKLSEPMACKNCKSTRYSARYCEVCIKQHLQKFFGTWTSGNGIVDKFIRKCQLISSVVLKSLNDSNDPGKDFFDEAINYFKIQSNSIVYCHGITRFPENGNYMIVMNSHPEGNLRNYLKLCEFANYEFVNIYKDGKSNNTTILISPNSNLEQINKPHPFALSSSRILSAVIPKSFRISNYVTSQYDLTLPEEMSKVQNDDGSQ
ncbi:3247_t:CDS:2 [Gigaspora margarita]|uniref:3247_t:CDS:1 n=1 Tax=Gigaspora margarita TaxID=4874 RepID=A0ABM8W6D5_GIGMA|nr:3247_t:CDS:2 [Gigaspora margarita]